jgi:hypothetical protein
MGMRIIMYKKVEREVKWLLVIRKERDVGKIKV